MNLFASAPPCIYIEPPHIAYSLSQTGQHVKHKILPVSKSLFFNWGVLFYAHSRVSVSGNVFHTRIIARRIVSFPSDITDATVNPYYRTAFSNDIK